MVRIKIREQDYVSKCTEDLSYPGVVDTIKKLAEDNSLFIVSNCQEGYIPLVTDKLGITPYIKDQECFGASGLLKADNIRLVLKRNNIPARDSVYIGDTKGDYDSAVEAGVNFIYAAYGFGDPLPFPDYKGRTIDSFSELKA